MPKQENVECLKQANRVVKKAKKEKSQIDIPDLGNLEQLKIGYILFWLETMQVYAHCLVIQAY